MGTHYNLLSDLTDVGFFAEVRDGLPKPLSSSTPVLGRSHPLVTFQRALLVESTASLGEWETALRLFQDLRGELESMGAEKSAALFVLGLAADPLSRELVRAGEAGRVRDLTEGLPRLASEASRAFGRCQPTPQASRK